MGQKQSRHTKAEYPLDQPTSTPLDSPSESLSNLQPNTPSVFEQEASLVQTLRKKAKDLDQEIQDAAKAGESVPNLELKQSEITVLKVSLEVKHFKSLSQQQITSYYNAQFYQRLKPIIDRLTDLQIGQSTAKEVQRNDELLDKINALMITSKIIPNINFILLAGGYLTRFPAKLFEGNLMDGILMVNIDNNFLMDLSIPTIGCYGTTTWSVQNNLLCRLSVNNGRGQELSRKFQALQQLNLIVDHNYLYHLDISPSVPVVHLSAANNQLENVILCEDWEALAYLNLSNNPMQDFILLPSTFPKLKLGNFIGPAGATVAEPLLTQFSNLNVHEQPSSENSDDETLEPEKVQPGSGSVRVQT